jgi:hypothetical protein
LEETHCKYASEFLFWGYFECGKLAVDSDFKYVVAFINIYESMVYFIDFYEFVVSFIDFYEFVVNFCDFYEFELDLFYGVADFSI